jgi:hypothetical protein
VAGGGPRTLQVGPVAPYVVAVTRTRYAVRPLRQLEYRTKSLRRLRPHLRPAQPPIRFPRLPRCALVPCRSSHRLWVRGGRVIKPAGHIVSPTERPAGCCYQWVQCQTPLMGGGLHFGHEVVRVESPNGASRRASPPRVGNGRNPGCSHDPTGLNGAQCVSEGTRARTSKHLVDGKHPGAARVGGNAQSSEGTRPPG